ncbi:hypothetical protein OZK63_39790, partial [Streptomyces sp. UMAF16]|nr:hypothetical protein [Streptomyces sp. UMAF16]
PNEHLAPNHIAELKQPMYATCLGLILKGYNDYESKSKDFSKQFKYIQVPHQLKEQTKIVETPMVQPTEKIGTAPKLNARFWDKFKNGIIELFKEEEDQIIR